MAITALLLLLFLLVVVVRDRVGATSLERAVVGRGLDMWLLLLLLLLRLGVLLWDFRVGRVDCCVGGCLAEDDFCFVVVLRGLAVLVVFSGCRGADLPVVVVGRFVCVCATTRGLVGAVGVVPRRGALVGRDSVSVRGRPRFVGRG